MVQSDCESTRRTMLRYKNKYRKLKNVENLNLLKNSCKIYKRNINKAYRDYENELIRKIRKLQSENPREYWKLIQGKRGPNSVPNISLETFKKHFENLTSGTQTNIEHREEIPVSDANPSLNEPFKDQDILKTIKQLINNKAAGHDQILNDFFKNSPSTFIPIYTRLFNLLLVSGQGPDDWCLSGVMPIYKNKGSANAPNNYRGISSLSCLGKLFTSCINNRLTDFVKKIILSVLQKLGLRLISPP